MPVPVVVDLYHEDNVTSFARARAAGLLGVIHKATTGATGSDDEYAARRKAATDAGLLWGAYHWGTHHAPVREQVDNFLAVAKPDAKTLVALDFERTPDNQMTLDQAREFLTLLGGILGRKPVIYGGSLLKESLGGAKDVFLGGHRLWLAQYGETPQTQASWSHFWLWQYSDGKDGPKDEEKFPRTVPGVSGNTAGQLDCDHYEGTAEQLAAEWAS